MPIRSESDVLRAIDALEGDLFDAATIAKILQRQPDTVSLHARRSNGTIGRSVGGRWFFTKEDIRKIAAIVLRGPGPRPVKFVDEVS